MNLNYKNIFNKKKEKKEKKEKQKSFDIFMPKKEDFLLNNLLELHELNYDEMKEESEKIGKSILEYVMLKNFITSKEVSVFFSDETGYPLLTGIGNLELKKDLTFYKIYSEQTIVVYYPFEELCRFLETKYPKYKIKILSYELYQIKEITTGEELKLDFISLVQQAVNLEVSDIHMEVKDYALEVKMRILGDMTLMETISLDKALRLQKYIKDIASRYTKASNFDTEGWEERQDARMTIEDLKIDLRLAFTPSLVDGMQNYVMRLLKQEGSIKTSEAANVMLSMGYMKEDVSVFYEWVKKPQGLILVSGPTGSGKSRMLNTLIASVSEEHKILTAEDPVEYKIPNATQHQVFKKEMQDKVIDMSFLQYIRAFMRQDPDIIFIGEWRKEKELTESIVYASNTGHLVLTSLHANSAAIIPSLLINDYGVEKEDVSNNSVGYINQILIKRICKACADSRKISDREMKKLQDTVEFKEDKELIKEKLDGKEVYFSGIGCEACTVMATNGNIISIGYTGRMATYEWITVDNELRMQMLTNIATSEINKVIRKKVIEGKAKRYIDVALKKLVNKDIDYHTFLDVLNRI